MMQLLSTSPLRFLRLLSVLCALLGLLSPMAEADFLVSRPEGYEAKMKADAIQAEVQKALAAAMGQGHGIGQGRLKGIRSVLSRIFLSLPKNAQERVQRPMLRYALHRYFAQRYSITVKGLEPARNASSNHHAVGAEILLDQVPAYTEAILEGSFSHDGFTLEDAVVMAATLEQLVLGSGTAGLQTAYALRNQSTSSVLNRGGLEDVLETYVLLWMIGDGADLAATKVVTDRAVIEESLPQWGDVSEFARGELDRSEHEAGGGNLFSKQYAFSNAQSIVGGITAGFGHWWEQECQGIKKNLADLDPQGTGRVPLSKFYRRAMEGEWRFGESEAYLRELGALDDSSYWTGPQVIIPNYLQGSNNCIIASTYYLVCCINECEARLEHVEDAVKAPVATPEQILPVVEGMLAMEEKRIEEVLVDQLQRIAETHNGKVPVHGRLFSQWMHYAFPQECPFPHPSGKTAPKTPLEFGEAYLATKHEMRKHARSVDRTVAAQLPSNLTIEEQSGMSQWLHEEELLTEYEELSKPRSLGNVGILVAASLLGVFALFIRGRLDLLEPKSKEFGFGGMGVRQHLV